MKAFWRLLATAIAVATMIPALGAGVASASSTPATMTSIAGAQAIGKNADGRLEVFSVQTGGMLMHDWQTSAGGYWSGWYSLGNPTGIVFSSAPAVILNNYGELELFVINSTGQLYHNAQISAGGNWGSWTQWGGSFATNATPSVIKNWDGRLEVFALGTDTTVYHAWQMSVGGVWTGFVSLGGALASAPKVMLNKDGRVEFFGIGTDMNLYHDWQISKGGNWYAGGVTELAGGPFAGTPSLVMNKDGRLEAFVMSGTAVMHIWQITPGGYWSALAGLISYVGQPAYMGSPAATINNDGRVEVFMLGVNKMMYHDWQMTAGGEWNPNGGAGLGGSSFSGTPKVTLNVDGRIEVFVIGGGGVLYHDWQTSAGGDWYANGWQSLV